MQEFGQASCLSFAGICVSGVQFENSACRNVTCSEDCELIHAQEGELRVKLVQRSVPAHVVKRLAVNFGREYVDQYIEYILRSECVNQMLI